ncbi:hypothetical protein [Microbulbifer thermotolerans]|uniref:hypothetical protein n=1 Tax=Microbulbifer thermotolerans TaxID=252514 RepID=UPI00224ABF3F|nr:hypothetical protein [Microbulbifer thermotolerans]MCX2803451.1 hypothetical protein [Microbulbifer thermotolerans]
MHKYKISVSPYFCEIAPDQRLAYTAEDLNIFKNKIKYGVAVFGCTPNILVILEGQYSHWDSLSTLVKALDTGKFAISSNNAPTEFSVFLKNSNPMIEVRFYNTSQIAQGRAWVRC